jgi:nicotinamide-nucleotide amidase
VGLVHFGIVRKGKQVQSERHVFPGDRSNIRRATVERALELLLTAAEQ